MTATKANHAPAMPTPPASRGVAALTASVLLAGVALIATSLPTTAAPAIRTSPGNKVPACATPDALMAFLRDRNPRVDARFADIAHWYRLFGEAWQVRWDYAFFQMALETNYLSYRRPDGQRGDVHERQNNFAGIGATGGGVPGDRFVDVKSGVHAQIQHLVAYSGEAVANPIAQRTQLRQQDIIEQSLRLRRAVTFGDLARRWAADRKYARSIDGVASEFRDRYCTGQLAALAASKPPRDEPPAPQAAQRRAATGDDAYRPPAKPYLRPFPAPSRLGGPPLKLAGPDLPAGRDQLPWADTPEPAGGAPAPLSNPPAPPASTPQPSAAPKAAPEAEAQSNVKAKAEKPAKSSPVRTIWSRGDAPLRARDSDDQTPPPQQQAGSAAIKPAAGAAPSEQRAADSATDDTPPALPAFRIAPSVPQPSRLGGPVPMPTLAEDPVSEPDSPDAIVARERETSAAETSATPSAGGTAPTDGCRVLTASYGGRKTLLVRAKVGQETQLTALTVLDGFEKSMFDIYAKASAPNAELIGEYDTADAALADARANCAR